MSRPTRRSIFRELLTLPSALSEHFHGQVELVVQEDLDISRILFDISPSKGVYRHGVFRFVFSIPDGYPNSCPDVSCFPAPFHPNIDPRSMVNNVCVNILSQWESTFDLLSVLHGILFLFYEPNFDSPLNNTISFENDVTFEKCVHCSLFGGTLSGIKYLPNAAFCAWANKNGIKPPPLPPELFTPLCPESFQPVLTNEPISEPIALPYVRQESHISDYFRRTLSPLYETWDELSIHTAASFSRDISYLQAFHITLQNPSNERHSIGNEPWTNFVRYYFIERTLDEFGNFLSEAVNSCAPPLFWIDVGIPGPIQRTSNRIWVPRRVPHTLADMALSFDTWMYYTSMENRDPDHLTPDSFSVRSQASDIRSEQNFTFEEISIPRNDSACFSADVITLAQKENENQTVICNASSSLVSHLDTSLKSEDPLTDLNHSAIASAHTVLENVCERSPRILCNYEDDSRTQDAVSDCENHSMLADCNDPFDDPLNAPAMDNIQYSGSPIMALDNDELQNVDEDAPNSEPPVGSVVLENILKEAESRSIVQKRRQYFKWLRVIFPFFGPPWFHLYQTRWPPVLAPGCLIAFNLPSHFNRSVCPASSSQLMVDLFFRSQCRDKPKSLLLVDPLALSPCSPIFNLVAEFPVDHIPAFFVDANCSWYSMCWLSVFDLIFGRVLTRQTASEWFLTSLLSVTYLISNWTAYFSRMETLGTCIGYRRPQLNWTISSIGCSCLYPATLGCGQAPLLDAWPMHLLTRMFHLSGAAMLKLNGNRLSALSDLPQCNIFIPFSDLHDL